MTDDLLARMAGVTRMEEVEELFESIVLDVQHRCYGPGTAGPQHLEVLVRRTLLQIDLLLLEEDE